MLAHVSDVSHERLKAAAVSGVRWGSIARVTAEASAFAATVVLAHLLVMGHGADFWRAVERADPAYRDGHAWLRRNGHTLRI